MPSLRIIFAGGGTGGHLFPAIAIAEDVRKLEPAAAILFVGTKGKIETRVVPQHGYAIETIWISGFRRRFSVNNFLFPLKLVVSMIQAMSIIRKYKPDVVVGTGGYVAGPVLRAAVMQGIPTLIQEQNSYPGVTTRILARKVNEVHLAFERSRQYLVRMDNVFTTGNPTRGNLEQVDVSDAYAYFGFRPEDKRKTALMFGGSLGAHTINEAVRAGIDEIMRQDLRIIWQTGHEDIGEARQASARYPRESVFVSEFIDRMDYAYAASDLVVCRAGATTIAELTRLGKPAILVPYPYAAANHQVENARTLASQGAAEIIDDGEISAKLSAVVSSLLKDDRLRTMGEQSKKLGKPSAAMDIARRVIELARHAHDGK